MKPPLDSLLPLSEGLDAELPLKMFSGIGIVMPKKVSGIALPSPGVGAGAGSGRNTVPGGGCCRS
ncbi:MAG: hypothetical protein AAFX93_19370 [Verrucomicrobiota bacterium]